MHCYRVFLCVLLKRKPFSNKRKKPKKRNRGNKTRAREGVGWGVLLEKYRIENNEQSELDGKRKRRGLRKHKHTNRRHHEAVE